MNMENMAEQLSAVNLGKQPVDPHDMEGSAARLLKMFDDLGYVVTLLRKVQNENARLLTENKELKVQLQQQQQAFVIQASREVWRQ